jgi:hypothetical protein
MMKWHSLVAQADTHAGVRPQSCTRLHMQHTSLTSGKSPRQTGAVFAVRRTRRRSHVANALVYHAMLPCRSLPQGH